ncbi:MAG TPA: lipopolysaccharide heptosyltransferase II [Pyrinomonadaceae bacterium]|jgi:heptosyltransferase-2|nr:lipopolysaccharide heptosyltransferase II [Pyrinomonadaceae bacterium]
MSNVPAESIKRVVVRGTNWVGDSLMTIPALRALRRVLPEAHITLVIRPGAKGIFAEADFIDELLVYDRKNAFSVVPQVREWKRRRFDLAVLFQNAFEAALIPFLAGVPLRLGYATESRQALLTHPLPVPDWRSSRHEVFYYLYLVTALEQMLFGHSTVCEAEPDASIQISETRKAEATELLRAFGVNEDDVVVAICPGSINSRAKRWPAESYASLADRLIESKRRVLLIGSKDEMDVSEDVTRRMRERPIVLTGKTTLDQITGILDRADLVVTNDTGPAHLGAALGRPTIVIFGPTNPLTTRPFAPEAVMLRHPPDCAPCMLRDCPIDHRCMTAITVDEVFEQSHALLKRGSFVKTVRSLCDSVA